MSSPLSFTDRIIGCVSYQCVLKCFVRDQPRQGKKKKEPCPRLGHGDQISNLSKEFEDEFKNNKTETIVIAHV